VALTTGRPFGAARRNISVCCSLPDLSGLGGAAELAGQSPDSPDFASTKTLTLATETIGFD
jgi:hypothetical protein